MRIGITGASSVLGEASVFHCAQLVFKTNFLSVYALLEPIIPKMIEQKSGEIVFISSIASLFTICRFLCRPREIARIVNAIERKNPTYVPF